MKGVRTPPPPRPPAFARKVMNIMTATPIISEKEGGIVIVFFWKIYSASKLVEFISLSIYQLIL